MLNVVPFQRNVEFGARVTLNERKLKGSRPMNLEPMCGLTLVCVATTILDSLRAHCFCTTLHNMCRPPLVKSTSFPIQAGMCDHPSNLHDRRFEYQFHRTRLCTPWGSFLSNCVPCAADLRFMCLPFGCTPNQRNQCRRDGVLVQLQPRKAFASVASLWAIASVAIASPAALVMSLWRSTLS